MDANRLGSREEGHMNKPTKMLLPAILVASLVALGTALAVDQPLLLKGLKLPAPSDTAALSRRLKLPSTVKYAGLAPDAKIAMAKQMGMDVHNFMSTASSGNGSVPLTLVFATNMTNGVLATGGSYSTMGWDAQMSASGGQVVTSFVATAGQMYLADCAVSPSVNYAIGSLFVVGATEQNFLSGTQTSTAAATPGATVGPASYGTVLISTLPAPASSEIVYGGVWVASGSPASSWTINGCTISAVQ
jgi:hypothetical protein